MSRNNRVNKRVNKRSNTMTKTNKRSKLWINKTSKETKITNIMNLITMEINRNYPSNSIRMKSHTLHNNSKNQILIFKNPEKFKLLKGSKLEISFQLMVNHKR